MGHQIFHGSIGQVAGKNIINHPKWDQLTSDELKRVMAEYKRERRGAFFRQWINLAALLLLLACTAFGIWGWYMIRIDGLSGEISAAKWVAFGCFVAVITGAALWLHLIRQAAITTISELDDDLKDINGVLRFRKAKR
ncbi:hypothetical protein [Pseudomonas fluorescens]|uniref:Transmembrane protein n=1 Tax=Pseudomonas fluorescens TaxID=294 RepID=A0A944HEP1_PSEFL|nr:hypothetical protein [Pseudomonas fluorescens]MBT2294533.1 hypothetical protein [Pseudomonas fluorescens]MBT2306811.1 hypothetical protein [Pseudomonas fluorescens]MBT2316279.1 hypothetical protein [Pseudomonas fluorescens]MBT2331616.1 hypothetical protein [Pseudomonas fluorescens]MBT2342784.1 hypothetical protein [Pseudomonas fluorescens]